MTGFWIDREKRRALAAWMLAGSGPALLILVAAIVSILTWGIVPAPLARVNYLGGIGLALCLLIAISLLTYGIDQALRTIKGSAGGVTFEATGQGNSDVTATVTNAAGDTATATVPTAPGAEAP